MKDYKEDTRTIYQILIDIQNLTKLLEEDTKKNMDGNVAAGKRVRSGMVTIKDWAFIIRQKIRDINGKYYEYKGKHPRGVIGRKKQQ